MAHRLVEIVAPQGHGDTIRAIAENHNAVDSWISEADASGRITAWLLMDKKDVQACIDVVQTALSGEDKRWRAVLIPVDAVLPTPEKEEDDDEKRRSVIRATREELFNEVEKGAKLHRNYLVLAFLSTVVAAIGLLQNNVAVVIGAMVIAPLLGPNLALAFAAALGHRDLMADALKTNFAGVSIALAVSALMGAVLQPEHLSDEIMSRTVVGYDSIALALASGAAAVLSLTTGLSAALVGVMVAVALLPPTAALGILAGSGHWQAALGAAILLAVNVVCVNLAAQIVFWTQGLRPRTWLEQQSARQSATLTASVWIVLLVVLAVAIWFYDGPLPQIPITPN
jgi:uncharacterized hydrophobic protein (TIGR00341 family)